MSTTDIEAWIDGDIDWEDLSVDDRAEIDAAVAALDVPTLDGDAMHQAAVVEPGDVVKSTIASRFTLGPWYIPDTEDAHGEWTDAAELQKALWDYVDSGDRGIRIQHMPQIVAGRWVEAMTWPFPVTVPMHKTTGEVEDVDYPANTVFLGVQWEDWAWPLVEKGLISGYSIGGKAARVDLPIPAVEKALEAVDKTATMAAATAATARHFGSRSEAARYAANQRWAQYGVGGRYGPKAKKPKRRRLRDLFRKPKQSETPRKLDVKVGPGAGPKFRGRTVGRYDSTTGDWVYGKPGTPVSSSPAEYRSRGTLGGSVVGKTAGGFRRVPALIDLGDRWEIVPIRWDGSRVRKVAALRCDGRTAVVEHDLMSGMWKARGAAEIESLPAEVLRQIEVGGPNVVGWSWVRKKSFGGNRSAAAQYAANIRWMRAAAGGIGPWGVPKGRTAKAVAGTCASLTGWCDFDAVVADMRKRGADMTEPPSIEDVYPHLHPDRRAMWGHIQGSFTRGVKPNPDGPDVYMLGGGTASGKSTALKSGLVKAPNPALREAVDVNPDKIKTHLPEFTSLNGKHLHPGAAGYAHEESSMIAYKISKAAIGQGKDIVVDGVGDSSPGKLGGKIATYRKQGAKKVHATYVFLETSEAWRRSDRRGFDPRGKPDGDYGRWVKGDAFVGAHRGVSANFEKYAASGMFDDVQVIDVRSEVPKPIFKILPGGRRQVLNRAAYDEFLAKSTDSWTPESSGIPDRVTSPPPPGEYYGFQWPGYKGPFAEPAG